VAHGYGGGRAHDAKRGQQVRDALIYAEAGASVWDQLHDDHEEAIADANV
jgi:hypothetical protein